MSTPERERSSFEEWISGPPFERETERWPQDETKHAWPGQYKDFAVELAWESWQEAQKADTKESGNVPSKPWKTSWKSSGQPNE